MIRRMFQRRGTAAEWIAANPILGPGEIGLEFDPGASPDVVPKFKWGDGVTHWIDLDYFDARALPIEDLGGYFAAVSVEAALQEIGALFATKAYADNLVQGLSWKQSVRVATTVSGTLSSSFENGDTVDGVTIATGDRILIKDQGTGAENGIYVVNASGAPTRAADANTGAEMVNASCYVSEGTANADTQWVCTTNAPITIGSTSLSFAQLTAGGGGGGSLTSGSVALTGADFTISSTTAADILASPSALAAGTYLVGAELYHTGLAQSPDFHITDGTVYKPLSQSVSNSEYNTICFCVLIVIASSAVLKLRIKPQTTNTITIPYLSARESRADACIMSWVKVG